ncbi:MAG: tRNA uridine-5-carboxymethylaminomethyl(34) synthesis GTPase MnmE [Betaproteobacteria bacterium]
MLAADTIAAIATAPGRAGIGVVRVSGPGTRSIATAILQQDLKPRLATLSYFVDADSTPLDRGIAIYYPAPNSYTGEDVLELQGHGGLAVVQLVLRRCLNLGARHAAPGEFTQRAFLNDKLDLAQAESVADLIDASSAMAARGAMRSLAGEFSDRVSRLVRELIQLRTYVEATLDFPEEEIDLPEREKFMARLDRLSHDVKVLLAEATQGKLLRDGIRLVLIGRPNVGKSSLLNRLVEDEVAIVTDTPGTTRDPLHHELVFEGIPIHVVDTAGLRDGAESIEKIGIERTWREIHQADLALFLIDASAGITEADTSILQDEFLEKLNKIFVFNKIDLIDQLPAIVSGENGLQVHLSVKTGAGLDLLREAVLKSMGWHPTMDGTFSARERHRQGLFLASQSLDRAIAASGSTELMAEELRAAQQAFSQLTGEFTSDDLLGEIFSKFCIGK